MTIETTYKKYAEGSSREKQGTKTSISEEKCLPKSVLSSMAPAGNWKTTVHMVETVTNMQWPGVPSSKLEDDHIDCVSVSLCKERSRASISNIYDNCNFPVQLVTQYGEGTDNNLVEEASSCNSHAISRNLVNPNKDDSKLSHAAISEGLMDSDGIEVKSVPLTFSRKNVKRLVSTENLSRKVSIFPITSLKNGIPSLETNTDIALKGRLHYELPQKRKISPKSEASNSEKSLQQISLDDSSSTQHEFLRGNEEYQGGFDHQLNNMGNLSYNLVPTSTCFEQMEDKKLTLVTATGSSMISDVVDVKSSSMVYSRKTPSRSALAKVSKKIGICSRSSAQGLIMKQVTDGTASTDRMSHNFSSLPTNSQSGNSDASIIQKSLTSSVSAQPDAPLAKTAFLNESSSPWSDAKIVSKIIIPASLTNNQKSSSLTSSLETSKRFMNHEYHSKSNVRTCLKGQLKNSFCCGDKHEVANSPVCMISEAQLKMPEPSFQLHSVIPLLDRQWNIQTDETAQAINLPSHSVQHHERVNLNPVDTSGQALSAGLMKRVVMKTKMICKREPSSEYSDKSSSVYSNDVGSPNDSTLRTEKENETEEGQKGMAGKVFKSITMEEFSNGPNDALTSDETIVIQSSRVSLTGKNVNIESASELKEMEEPVLKKVVVSKGVREKIKCYRRHQNNCCTDNAADATILGWNDAEKENKPARNAGIIWKTYDLEGQSITIKCGGKSGLSNIGINDMTSSKLQKYFHEDVTSQHAYFIFSGHQIERKEFQKVVKLLRGRFCKDSHSWSYQASHLIVPHPIRRTEKFFAATASGRWVLRPEYLSACSEAGKFLDEEPFEWHGDCLTDDGKISLLVPRKWRLIRERTGHGAFYGLSIIIYGECIAPSLDTLKRAIKAGDGTIQASSPPYTRFLKTVDFAVVSPSIPRADTWIQEFLRHEIPCVLADYLVEYVCKNGFPLDKHVLYETHAWAEKCLAKLQTLSKESRSLSAKGPGLRSLSLSSIASQERLSFAAR